VQRIPPSLRGSGISPAEGVKLVRALEMDEEHQLWVEDKGKDTARDTGLRLRAADLERLCSSLESARRYEMIAGTFGSVGAFMGVQLSPDSTSERVKGALESAGLESAEPVDVSLLEVGDQHAILVGPAGSQVRFPDLDAASAEGSPAE
jgi:hypothetical protein